MARRNRDGKTRDLFDFADDNLKPTIVYIATNTITRHRYIGITRRPLKARQASHFSDAVRVGAKRYAFQRAIAEYGRDAFVWDVVGTFQTYKEAAREEIRLISEMAPEYNVSLGGDGVAEIGYRPSDATRRKMSRAKIGSPGYWTGKKRSAESIAKRTATRALNPVRPWLGKKRDAETIEKMSRGRRKLVVCLDDGKVYSGLKAAAAAYDIRGHRDISKVCTGRAKTCGGRRFAYVDGMESAT